MHCEVELRQDKTCALNFFENNMFLLRKEEIVLIRHMPNAEFICCLSANICHRRYFLVVNVQNVLGVKIQGVGQNGGRLNCSRLLPQKKKRLLPAKSALVVESSIKSPPTYGGPIGFSNQQRELAITCFCVATLEFLTRSDPSHLLSLASKSAQKV